MKSFKWTRLLLILLPSIILGGFIIAVAWTFGTSTAGQILGTLEGVIIILVGTGVTFSAQIRPLFSKMKRTK